MLSGLCLIALAAIAWGTTGATMTLLSRDAAASPLVVGWARLAVAASCLGTALLVVQPFTRGGLPGASAARLTGRPPGTALVAGAAMAGYQLCYFSAVTLTGVAPAALLAICSAPIMIAVLAAALLGERITARVLVPLAMAVAGTALLVLGPHGLGEISGRFALGALLALGAGLSYAAFAVAAKGLVGRMSPLAVATWTFALAALLLAPALLVQPAWRQMLAAGWPLLLYLGVGPTAVAYVLFTVGLARVPATVAGIVTLLEPLTATILGVACFGEALGATGWVGAGVLIAAVALLARPRPPARGVRAGGR